MNGAPEVCYEYAVRTFQTAFCSRSQRSKIRTHWRKNARDHSRVRGLLEIRSRAPGNFLPQTERRFPCNNRPYSWEVQIYECVPHPRQNYAISGAGSDHGRGAVKTRTLLPNLAFQAFQ